MDKTKGTIGTREFIAIIILTIGTKLADDTPSLFFSSMGSAAWMAPIIIGVTTILPVFFILKIFTIYPNKTFVEIIKEVFGKYVGFFVLFALWIIQIYALIIDSSIYTDIMGTMYFNDTPTIVIYAVLISVAAYGAKKGFEHISSYAWIIIAGVKVTALTVLVLIVLQGRPEFIFPLFGTGKWEIIKGSTSYISIFSDLFYFAFIASYLKSTKVLKKGMWIGLAFITIEISTAIMSYVMLFDFNGIKLIDYPYHESIRTIQLGFIRNTESLFFPFWLIATFARFSFYFYISVLLFSTLFKISQKEFIIPILATLIVFFGMIPETPTFAIYTLRGEFLKLVTPVFLFLPFVIWVLAKLKGGSKNDKKKAAE